MKVPTGLGPLQVESRTPSVLWAGGRDVAVIRAGDVGFADASEADRSQWLNGFRRLLDGLDTPLQVLIDMAPGSDPALDLERPAPVDFDEMRGADLSFAEQVAALQASTSRRVTFVVADAHALRLEQALRAMGVSTRRDPPVEQRVFGRELSDSVLDARGCSRTWYVERLPGMELEPGWLFGLLPSGLRLTLAWHATPLPTAWIVDYLQRQLVNMRATRLQQETAAAADPVLAGALPATESLQRRLAASQEKAFHVSTYLTLRAATVEALDAGTEQVLSCARAVLCRLQPCTFRMFDGLLATQRVGVDRLQRKRVLDTSSLTTFLPWLDADLQEPGGLIVGRNRSTGSPVTIDPFDAHRYSNANIAVFGHSGAGKTYLLSTLAMGALGTGTQVFLIDPEHEYGRLAASIGGVDVQLALGSGHALNVLDLRPGDQRDETWLGPATADAVDLCATVCGRRANHLHAGGATAAAGRRAQAA